MSVLPAQWTEVEIGDLVELLKNGISVPQNREGRGIPVTRIETIATGKINPDRIGFVSDVAAQDASDHRLHAGDILFSHINSSAHLGKTAIYIGEPPVLFHGTNLLLVRACKDVCNSRYLEYGFRYMRASRVFELNAQHAVNQASLNQAKLRKLVLPVAPFNEQKRIAEKLDTVLARVDACRERLDRIPAILKRFRQSVLAAAFSGELTEEWRAKQVVGTSNPVSREVYLPDGWQELPLRDCIGEMTGGASPSSSDYAIDGTLVLNKGDIKEYGDVVLKQVQNRIPSAYVEKHKNKIIKQGDILLTLRDLSAKADFLGLIGKYTGKELALITQGMFALKVNDCLLDDFLVLFSNSPKYRETVKREKVGATQVHLRNDQFLKIYLPLPPLAEQREIVRRVGLLFTYVEKVEASMTVARKRVERLTPALLAKAFRGELVPQNPNDEAAEVLLTKIGTAKVVAVTRLRKQKLSKIVKSKS